jgi:hypothetical protein
MNKKNERSITFGTYLGREKGDSLILCWEGSFIEDHMP